jgi:hypothetical protein
MSMKGFKYITKKWTLFLEQRNDPFFSDPGSIGWKHGKIQLKGNPFARVRIRPDLTTLTHNGKEIKLDEKTASAFQALVEEYGAEMLEVTSAYRDTKQNTKAGGAEKSQHLYGKAIDLTNPFQNEDGSIRLDELKSFVTFAQGVGFTSFGFGKKTIHIDTRKNPKWWIYDNSGKRVEGEEKCVVSQRTHFYKDRVPDIFLQKCPCTGCGSEYIESLKGSDE